MTFEYNPSKLTVFDAMRKLSFRDDPVESRESQFDLDQVTFQFTDENAKRVFAFRAPFFPTIGAPDGRCQTVIILTDTILPDSNFPIEYLVEAILALSSRGEESMKCFIEIESAENMFAVQNNYPGYFKNFERWARAYKHPLSDGSKSVERPTLKVLHKSVCTP
jgi:hypothetical protein